MTMPRSRPTGPEDLVDPTGTLIVLATPDGQVQAVLVPSHSHPGAFHAVRVSPAGAVSCDCPAGRFGKRCRHRRLAAEARLVAARALVARRLTERAQALGVRPATAADLYRQD